MSNIVNEIKVEREDLYLGRRANKSVGQSTKRIGRRSRAGNGTSSSTGNKLTHRHDTIFLPLPNYTIPDRVGDLLSISGAWRCSLPGFASCFFFFFFFVFLLLLALSLNGKNNHNLLINFFRLQSGGSGRP